MPPASAPRTRKETTIDRAESARLYCLFALDAFFLQRASSLPAAGGHSARSHTRFCGPLAGISEIAIFRSLWPLPRAVKTMSSVKATQLRPGMVIQHRGQLFTLFIVDHPTPGNKPGSMQTRMT